MARRGTVRSLAADTMTRPSDHTHTCARQFRVTALPGPGIPTTTKPVSGEGAESRESVALQRGGTGVSLRVRKRDLEKRATAEGAQKLGHHFPGASDTVQATCREDGAHISPCF